MSEKPDFENLRDLPEKKLEALVEYHNRRYWELGEPEITDEEFDLLVRQLEKINPESAILQKVYAPAVAGTGKIRHKKPMLSLAKVYSLPELMDWASKYARDKGEEFLIQPKYDGISANYSDGVLASRGDGEEGENITDKLCLIELETKNYRGPVDRPARGEIVIRDDDFKNIYSDIRRKDGKTYKNSRNAVAGIMGLKDISSVKNQGAKLTLVDYNMISYRLKLSELKDSWPIVLEEIESLPYPMDGIVVKLADEEFSDSLGTTAHHPRGQIAFKFSGVRRTTKLLAVEWSFGKNCLTPVAELEPVDIGGITIRHATLHNAQNIVDKGVKIGDTVTVERAGDVIPYIVSSQPGKDRKDALISECPSCGSPLYREGPELCCKNPECFETNLQRLLAAVKNIGIERLGEPNIRRMMKKLSVKSLKDIFALKKEDILRLEGFKEKSASNLINEINSARKVNDFQLLAALNIPGIGKTVAKSILTEYTLSELRELSLEKLSAINGIGPERAKAIERELKSQKEFIDEMRGCVEIIQTKGGLKNPTICFTGKMPEKRSYYEGLASEQGYDAVDSVSSDLSLLVADHPDGNSGKLAKAKRAGVKIIGLEEWLKDISIQKENDTDSEFSDLPLFSREERI